MFDIAAIRILLPRNAIEQIFLDRPCDLTLAEEGEETVL
jgi:hypothetical protein